MMKHIKTNNAFFFAILMLFLLCSCEDFVEVELPDHKITSETVFANDETARSAMTGIYNELFNTSFANGGLRSVTFLSGLSADNFRLTSNTNEILEFHQNNITAPNDWNLDLWAGAYHMLYMTNAVLDGIENSTSLTPETKRSIEGQAKFVRAFTYFYLTNLYGDIPLLLSTDYRTNATAARDTQSIIYDQIISDLEDALVLLEEDYLEGNRTRPNRYAAMAMLARVYLYLQDWQQAEYYSNQVISQASLYELLDNPDEVFLADSGEAIWQITPIGWGSSFTHTREGNLFIFNPTTSTPVALSDSFMNIWEDQQDLRFTQWIGNFSDDEESFYYPYKYKVQYDASGGEITEYSMVMRLAEQYLIRAEARAETGNLDGSIADIDKVRERAGIPLLADVQPGATREELLTIILNERRKELFAEWGHRWFDLRRFGVSSVLEEKENAVWQQTDWWYPIPQEERMKNPKLTQNNGY